jgi:hypothetical protein
MACQTWCKMQTFLHSDYMLRSRAHSRTQWRTLLSAIHSRVLSSDESANWPSWPPVSKTLAAAGSSQVHGHGFWFFNNPKLTSSAPDMPAIGVIMPAIQRAPLPGGDANLLVDAIVKNQLSVFTVGPSDPPSLSGAAFALNFAFTSPRQAPQPPPGLPLNYNQLGLTPITAYWRGQVLYTAFTDCVRFGDMAAGRAAPGRV